MIFNPPHRIYIEYKTYDNTILIVGEKYYWSGSSEGLYTVTHWRNLKCKIRRVDGDRIFIYDYGDNKEWEFSGNDLRKNGVIFKKRNLFNFFKVIKEEISIR